MELGSGGLPPRLWEGGGKGFVIARAISKFPRGFVLAVVLLGGYFGTTFCVGSHCYSCFFSLICFPSPSDSLLAFVRDGESPRPLLSPSDSGIFPHVSVPILFFLSVSRQPGPHRVSFCYYCVPFYRSKCIIRSPLPLGFWVCNFYRGYFEVPSALRNNNINCNAFPKRILLRGNRCPSFATAYRPITAKKLFAVESLTATRSSKKNF